MAVRDVSLEVRRGEIVGIIGPNGAGKTTLLKMIAGLFPVDKGRIDVFGKVTVLLALGVGVHPEFTGRENLFYTGLLLGIPKREILRKMDEIVEFSELGGFIDQPFRTYSSGMRARLLFSVAMSVDPSVLIIDEALATGDAHFLEKSQERVRQLCGSGATVLFVSHNLRQVQELCPRCIFMESGSVLFDGDTTEAIAHYVERVYAREDQRLERVNGSRHHTMTGTGEVTIDDFFFTDDGTRTNTLTIGRPCKLHIDYTAKESLADVRLCVELRSNKVGIPYAFLPTSVPAFYNGDMSAVQSFALRQGKGRITLAFSKLLLGDGGYWCDVELYPAIIDHTFSYEKCYCHYNRIYQFNAVYSEHELFGRGTITELPLESVSVESCG
jgi:ABC-type polysaccharide/polyol phosphate transport system ATPase subunit